MNDVFSTLSKLQTLLRYAEQFLDRSRNNIDIGEFRAYLANLTEDISALDDLESMARIQAALGEVGKCDYVIRNSPEMKQEFLIPAIEKLVGSIRNRAQLTH